MEFVPRAGRSYFRQTLRRLQSRKILISYRTMGQKKRVLAILDDLFFLVKIQDAAKRVGLDVVFVKTAEQAMAKAGDHPDLIVLDLNHKGAHPLELITSLKATCQSPDCRIMAFVSHVETDLRQQATRLGCDLVLPRSAFSANLPKLLETYCNYQGPAAPGSAFTVAGA